MRIRAIALIALLAAALGGSALAASFVRDPSQMLLRKSDFPANVKYSSGDVPANVIQALKRVKIQARGVYFGATIPSGSGKSEVVSGAVYTTANAGQAVKAYVAFKSDMGGGSKVTLPKVGDDQIARYKPGSSVMNMIARRNSVIWQLTVEGMGLTIPQAKLTAEMTKYAHKQQARVGAG